ncbi:MAG: hypothetical protein K8F92_06575 [Hyphomicrobium sp.]|uniref:DUF6129 family protein n=1 Tax=Hyphomicrobium sp. TaxID=82 RepID=UPI001322531F|nr:DUF6129 family protein [Hyphomicrobium sp.]KAB2944007.1 MAG: hypothetical protein F9K20_00860 [Hyphomicrobium sp.]MBZ0209299.1 hypothetical protein [Hyphomicrobium sp.]MCZ7593836.1 DUF6129 family protein [Hyphomicrobium sp.]
MSIDADEIAHIEELLARAPAETLFAELRERFPDLSLTRCDASDIDTETPFREYGRYSLYLVDSADHCWRLTDDPRQATGLVVAVRKALS